MNCPDCHVRLRGDSCPCGWSPQKKAVNTFPCEYYENIKRNRSSPETAKKWLAEIRNKIGRHKIPKMERYIPEPIPEEIKLMVKEEDRKKEDLA